MVPRFILVENLEIATYIHDNDTESTVTEDENHRASGDAGETEHGLHVSSGGTRGCHLGVVLWRVTALRGQGRVAAFQALPLVRLEI